MLSPTIPLLIGKLICHTIVHATKWCNINATTTAAVLAEALTAAEAEKNAKVQEIEAEKKCILHTDGFLDFHLNDSLF